MTKFVINLRINFYCMWKKIVGVGALLYATNRLSKEVDIEEIKEKFELAPQEKYALETAQDISDLVQKVLEENSPHLKFAKPGVVYFSSMRQCARNSEATGFLITSHSDGYNIKYIRDCLPGPGYKVYKKESVYPDSFYAEERNNFELIDGVYWQLLK